MFPTLRQNFFGSVNKTAFYVSIVDIWRGNSFSQKKKHFSSRQKIVGLLSSFFQLEGQNWILRVNVNRIILRKIVSSEKLIIL